MYKIKVWILTAIVCILLTACGQELESPIIVEPSTIESGSSSTSGEGASQSEASSASAEDVDSDDTLPPDEGMVRSRLTNEWIYENVANTRPIAVMTPNESAAIPHYNLSKASVIYEANVEGRMTRMLAIYEDWEDLKKIGNIRSLRTYYGYWALEWDAFIVHWGGPFFVSEVLDKDNVEDLDGAKGTDTSGFFRSADRKDPHNAYADGADLKALISTKGFSLSYRENLIDDYHYNFTPKAEPNTLTQYADAQDAVLIDMSSCYPLTRCYFKYNEDDGLYYRYQHLSGSTDGPHMDAATGEQLTFKNILVQYTKHEELGEGYLAFQCHDTTRDGWFFTNGKGIHVNWEKTSDFGATRYYDDFGNEITMNTGKTMVLIVEDGDTFSFK
ncbi:MAG: DUF3048 domain-containing protein [Lachnospiraceae bacterium]|nr:DUF3048 domain-containing protein [Lachnospiraceae bacterium]MBQ8232117.1 DUF3048 domain-containing protein [Lachnospiraceae bacterium]